MSGTVLSKLSVSMEGPLVWDEVGSQKYLLCDKQGFLYLVVLSNSMIQCSELGRINPCSVVRYIDNRVFYAGNYQGPSSLYRITQTRLENISVIPNNGPIIDMIPVTGNVPGETHLLGIGGYNEVGLRGRVDL